MFKKKKLEKKTYITINSIDRIKKNKIVSELNYTSVDSNGLFIDFSIVELILSNISLDFLFNLY